MIVLFILTAIGQATILSYILHLSAWAVRTVRAETIILQKKLLVLSVVAYICAASFRCLCSESETILPRYIVKDEGYLNSSYFALPLTGFTLSGTGFEDHQYQYHTVGPLVCYECKFPDEDYCII